MNNPFTLYEQEVLTALYKSLTYCEEYDLPTYEISKVICDLESKVMQIYLVYRPSYTLREEDKC